MRPAVPGELPDGGRYVLEPGIVLAPDGPHEGWTVAVDGERFVAVGPADGLPPELRGLPRARRPDLALTPGFVDCHNHVSQAFAKAVTCGEPSQLWRRVWVPLRAAMTPDDVYLATKWAAIELVRGGFTTVVVAGERPGDATVASLRALGEVGIRAVFALSFADSADPLMRAASRREPPPTADVLRQAERALADVPTHPRVSPSLSCGTVHSASPALVAGVSRLAAEAGVLFQMHANEHTAEVEHALTTYGRRPIEMLHEQGALGPRTLLAHTTLVTPGELRLLAETGTAVSYNPVASAWKGNAVAPALALAEAGVRLGLGTDATRNDGFRLVDAAESAQRLVYGIATDDFSAGGGGRWLHAATAGGADAAGLGGRTGVVAPGMRADFLLLSRSTPECQPSWDFVWELVRYYDRTNLAAVYVDGRLLVRDGRLTTCDADAFVADTLDRARRVVNAAPIVRVHGPARIPRVRTGPTGRSRLCHDLDA